VTGSLQGKSDMSEFIIDPPAQASVAVAGTEQRFPVRRIFCVGRNYAAHAREMGKDPDRDPPFFFTKPADAVVDSGATIPYPSLTKNLHHEIELVVAIGKAGAGVSSGHAADHIWGYAVGIDLTRRDLQEDAKKHGRPWDWSKGFDRSAPCAPLVRRSDLMKSGRIWLSVNGQTRQDADLSELIWPVADIVALCSEAVALMPGDLIYTGTPAGVGPLSPGDNVAGGIEGVGAIDITIARPEG
jgi:fumarylpyruvate hydrolase